MLVLLVLDQLNDAIVSIVFDVAISLLKKQKVQIVWLRTEVQISVTKRPTKQNYRSKRRYKSSIIN